MLKESRELRIPLRDELGSSKQVRCDSPDQVSMDRAGSACCLESYASGPDSCAIGGSDDPEPDQFVESRADAHELDCVH